MAKKAITTPMMHSPLCRVIQAVEPDAARLLIQHGGKVMCYALHGMYYGEDQFYADQLLLSWPPDTLSVYVSARGQEDSTVTFAVFLLPTSKQELHLVYDYRANSLSSDFEEYFTLRVAHQQEYIITQALPEMVSHLDPS